MKPHTFLYDLKDVLSHVPSLQTIRFDPNSDKSLLFKAAAADDPHKIITLNGHTHGPIDGFDDTCGIIGLGFAFSILDAPGFDRVNVSSIWTGGDHIALESALQRYKVSLASKNFINEVCQVPPLRRGTVTFDATAAATEEGLQLLKYWRAEYHKTFFYKAGREPTLHLSASSGVLYAEHREYPRDYSKFPISTICVGDIPVTKHRYNIQVLAQLLSRVGSSASTIITVAPQGVVLVEVKTTHCTYEFSLPGMY